MQKPSTLNPLDMTEELYESAKASFGEELLQKCQYRYFNTTPNKFGSNRNYHDSYNQSRYDGRDRYDSRRNE